MPVVSEVSHFHLQEGSRVSKLEEKAPRGLSKGTVALGLFIFIAVDCFYMCWEDKMCECLNSVVWLYDDF